MKWVLAGWSHNSPHQTTQAADNPKRATVLHKKLASFACRYRRLPFRGGWYFQTFHRLVSAPAPAAEVRGK